MIKVSIIVPVYNTQSYLRKCIDSLVHQTLSDIEVILVNDGSTDGSVDILQEYEEKYPQKVRVIHKENGGQATARNLGIQCAQGEYLGFVDSDDYVDIHMYEEMYETAHKQNCDMVECRYEYLTEEGEQLPTYGSIRPYKGQRDMFMNPLVSPWNKLIRTSIVKENGIIFPEGYIYEDTAFYIKLIPYMNNIQLIDKAFVYHIDRGDSTMNANRSKRVGNIFPVLEDILKFYQEKKLGQEYEAELEFFCVKILLCSSLERISRIRDVKLRNSFIKDTLGMIRERFPNYRKNPYMKHGKKQLYMKSMNGLTIYVWVWLLGIIRSK